MTCPKSTTPASYKGRRGDEEPLGGPKACLENRLCVDVVVYSRDGSHGPESIQQLQVEECEGISRGGTPDVDYPVFLTKEEATCMEATSDFETSVRFQSLKGRRGPLVEWLSDGAIVSQYAA